ncbi:MAG TPA: FadR/GntR family transcriptional regulator [Mycobacteriales bacterium]|nr:FadR/GntR family transcriptional regulator [Mycobacteriales bacterium]
MAAPAQTPPTSRSAKQSSPRSAPKSGGRAGGNGIWQPVTEHGSLADRIVSQVEQLIADERLRPGDRLPSERDMAALLQVSRPSLREAVRILQARGRLLVRHGQGVFVREARVERELRKALLATEVTAGELFSMREVLEVPAAAWAAQQITDAQLAGLRKILDKMGSMIDARRPLNFDALAALDVDFHMGIIAAAGNRFMRQTSGVLHEMLLSGMETTLAIPGRPESSRRDHEQIYAALVAHDPSAARKASRAHIRAAHAAALRRIEQARSAGRAP